MSAATVPRYVPGSTCLHRCDPCATDACDCSYDATCSGREHGRMVKVPLWLARLLWPRHYLAVRRARRILKANGAWRYG